MEDYKRSSWRIPGASTNSVYDDIFGGPPRIAGVPYVAETAASRVDEYALIFGGRDGSSIPVLDPPPVVEVAGSRSSDFDYDEIFRGFDGGDFGVPYEALFLEAETSRDLPTRSDSEQEELKTLWVPSVRMNGDDVNFHDKNEDPFSTNRDSHHLPDSTKKSNMSNHQISWRSDEVSGVATHISELHDVPGYRFVVDASSGCQTESITVELSNGSLNGEVVKAEHLKKDELYSISSDCSIDHLKTFQDPRSPNSNALRWKLKVEKQFFEMEQEANSKKIQDFLLAEGNEKLKAVGHTIRQERSQKKVVVDKQETKKLRADREPCVLKEIKELKTANSEKSKRSAEETYELDESGKTLKTDSQAYDHKESDKNLAEEAYKHKESEMKLREAIEAHDHEDKENMGFLLKAEKTLKAEIKARECEERGRNCVDIEKRLDKEDCVDIEESKKKHKEAKGALEHEERERNIGEEVQNIEDNEKTLVEEAYIHEENEKEALEREEREKETMNEAQGLKRNGMSRNTTTDRKHGSWQVDSKLRQAENGPEKNEYENNRTSAHVLCKEENIENGSGVIRRSHNIRVDMSHNLEEIKKRAKASQEVRQRFQNGRESEAAQHGILPRGSEDTPKPALRVPMNQLVQEEKKHSSQKMDKEERIQREMEERARKLDEEREREREREKDRIISVEIATREREQRDSAEKTTMEVRQRAMAEAREKAAAEARGKLLAEKAVAKLRAHRTAVERANAEAHERAAEKPPAEKGAFDARERAERSFSERSTAPYRDWQSTSFKDARYSSHDRKFHDRGPFNAFNSSEKFHGTEFDSPFRCRAQLEMHQQTSEQRSLADTVDDEVIRWFNGKGGSLCALLSTLQYILIPECGWQPIPLTEMITTQDVKRAYKRAALCVHPDKVQQRSAGIREKHICEKVFNLLKEAMDKFDAEQRRTGVC